MVCGAVAETFPHLRHARPPNNCNDSLIDHPLPPHLSLADRLSLPPIMALQRLTPSPLLVQRRLYNFILGPLIYAK